jgi:3-keto-L-gulonate-6-phosphate decarboxylase
MAEKKGAITFQLSLDRKTLEEAVDMAALGVAAGVHVIEAGTILILSEGGRRVIPRLKELFPAHPIVADAKCTDGAGLEVALMFDLGASGATVMASASDASIQMAVREAENRPGCEVMVDTMGFGGPDGLDVARQVDAAKRARDLGAHYVVLHLGYDERTADPRMVDNNVLLRWAEAVASHNLGIKTQVVGGLTLAQAKQLPAMGITEIVLSMNLGSSPVPSAEYDKLSAFTVDLSDDRDRARVTHQIRNFIQEVSGSIA